jgi:hypothetical protein
MLDYVAEAFSSSAASFFEFGDCTRDFFASSSAGFLLVVL